MRALSIALLTVFVVGPSARAEDKFRMDVVPYYGFVDYANGSVKKDGHLAGAYTYLGYGLKHLFEGEIDYSRIDYDDDADFRLEQWDYSLVYTNFAIPNWKIRLGAHYVNSNDAQTDGSLIAITGAHYYVYGKWDGGLDFYMTQYDNFSPDMNAFQLTPHFGINFWQSEDKALRSDTRLYYINLTDDVGLGDTEFYSLEEKVSLYAGPWSFGVFFWFGKQTFAVRNDGFTVYNLSEEHTSGYGGEIKFAFTRTARSGLTVRVAQENFEDFGSSQEASSLMFSFLLGMSF